MMKLTVERAREGMLGFDLDQKITASLAKQLVEHGYSFAVRYVRRSPHNTQDLTFDEVTDILSAGLGLMIVQHVAPEGWMPNRDLGGLYGQIAVREIQSLKLPVGTMVWCDLEGVSHKAATRDIIEYCNAWYEQLAFAGFTPGLYVGFECGLNAISLYRELKFSRYWAAYNLNLDEYPWQRGVCVKQRVALPEDRVPGLIEDGFDLDVILTDDLGGLPVLLYGRAE